LEAKRWGRQLGEPNRTDAKGAKGRYPHQQIRDYLSESETLRWGILSNGRHWRLYCRDTVSSHYFEINLEHALKDLGSFKFFMCLFHPDAFSGVSGRTRLDDIRAEAGRYQETVEDDLRGRVFRALEVLAQGFYDYPANNLTEARLDEIYHHSLIFLYRLLFVLNAEANGLLPERKNSRYQRDYSLCRLKEDLDHVAPGHYLSSETMLYERLSKLFHLINGDDPRKNHDIGVHRYNGGLFDPGSYEFLEKYKAPDSAVAEALRQIGFRLVEGEWRQIDYSDLGQRHLGSIYEGLLEHRLVLKAAMPERRRSRGGQESTLSLFRPEDFGRRGWLVLERDEDCGPSRRRETGSFFTPAFAVSYIVDRTLCPLIERIEEPFRGRTQRDDSFANAVLSLKILDPAMGSGHFLVEATRNLAEAIATHPTTVLHTKEGEDREARDEDELAFWRRRVVESCIFGVDVNPLAVELAKVSLWIATASRDKALNFLNHHLRVGNSLVGTWTQDLPSPPGAKKSSTETMDAFECAVEQNMKALVAYFRNIEDAPSDTKEDVDKKDDEYGEFVRQVEPYRNLADIRTRFYFGIAVSDRDYSDFRDILLLSNRVSEETRERLSGRVKTDAKPLPGFPFHWDLEFPEVFFKEDPGFDAVVGNPPYIRQERLKSQKPFLKTFPCFHGTADIYVYFYTQGLRLLRKGGFLGFISSNKFMRAEYGKTLRPMLLGESSLREIVDFGELPVFKEAATFPAICVVEKKPYTGEPVRYCAVTDLEFDSLRNLVEQRGTWLAKGAFEGANWSLGTELETVLMRKMERAGVRLGQYVVSRIKFGIKTGYNDAYVIDRTTRDRLIKQDPRSEELIKPLLVGDDIRRYEIGFRERYLIVTRIGVNISRFPAISGHLSRFKKQLETRWDKGDHWYELRPCDYYDAFGKQKIVLPDIAITARFAMDTSGGFFLLNTGYIIPVKDFYLLALLNSRLVEYYYRMISSVLGDPHKRGRMRFIYQYLERIPIPRVPSRKKGRTNSAQQLLAPYEEGDTTGVLERVEVCLTDEAGQAGIVRDFLGHLAKEMIRLHEQKQEEQRRFADYLILGQGLPLDRYRTPLSSLHELDWSAFRDGLKKRKADPARWSGDKFRLIRNEFDKRQAAIRPILQSIAATDRLIDQIVYRLYCLTPEEIRLVEGSPR
jgi:type I restriction-modification system DNA methylase subunit